jgi:RHS repeat-associated protein
LYAQSIGKDVWFDHLMIGHYSSQVIAEDHYYPFGLTLSLDQNQNVTKNPYKLTTKELESKFDLNLYDFGARNFDMTRGQWNGPDAMAEKYYNISPYAYCGNNPIMFVDPDGMTIKDPDNIISGYKSEKKQSNKDVQSLIDNGTIKKEWGDKVISLNNDALKQVTQLENSTQVYTFSNGTNKSGEGGMGYDAVTDEVMIPISAPGNTGLVGHEIDHGVQFDEGRVSLTLSNNSLGSLYDIGDETEAYNIERSLNSRFESVQNQKFHWTDNDVINFGKTMTPPAYQNLPTGPININSKEGKALRQKTIDAGRQGSAVQEFYKNWKKDYNKGQNIK